MNQCGRYRAAYRFGTSWYPRQKPENDLETGIKRALPGARNKKLLVRLLENNLIRRVSFEEYREKVRDVYDGPQGAMLAYCSLISLHTMLGERLFKERKFDLSGVRNILDVGSGAGQIAKHLLKYAHPEAELSCFDLSHEMLRRARNRLKSEPAQVRGGRSYPAAFPFGNIRLRHLRLRAGTRAGSEGRAGRVEPGDGTRGPDAAFDDRGQFCRGLHEFHVALPDL